MLKIQFDHSQDSISAALGCTDKDRKYAKHVMMFESVNCYVQVHKLYGSWDEAPVELKSLSAQVERCVKRCNNDSQIAYMLLNFLQVREKLFDGVTESSDALKGKSLKGKKGVEELLRTLLDSMKAIPLKMLIQTVEKANGSFDEYIKIVEGKSEGSSYEEDDDMTDIDRLIKNALKNKDKDEDD